MGLALPGASPDLEPWYLLNRDLPVPTEMVVQFGRHGPIAYSDDPSLPRDAVYHVPSPLEPTKIDRVWPPRLRDQPFVVTLHDLIPAVFPAENMPDGAVRRVYWTRLELLRHADRVLNVSQATARDAVNMLGLRQERMVVTGGGVSPDFRPPASRSAGTRRPAPGPAGDRRRVRALHGGHGLPEERRRSAHRLRRPRERSFGTATSW